MKSILAIEGIVHKSITRIINQIEIKDNAVWKNTLISFIILFSSIFEGDYY